jgi:hypothetical protein
MFIFFISSSSSSFWKIYKTIVCSRAIVRGHPITLLLLLNILIHPNKPKNLVERCGCEFLFYFILYSPRGIDASREKRKRYD